MIRSSCNITALCISFCIGLFAPAIAHAEDSEPKVEWITDSYNVACLSPTVLKEAYTALREKDPVRMKALGCLRLKAGLRLDVLGGHIDALQAAGRPMRAGEVWKVRVYSPDRKYSTTLFMRGVFADVAPESEGIQLPFITFGPFETEAVALKLWQDIEKRAHLEAHKLSTVVTGEDGNPTGRNLFVLNPSLGEAIKLCDAVDIDKWGTCY